MKKQFWCGIVAAMALFVVGCGGPSLSPTPGQEPGKQIITVGIYGFDEYDSGLGPVLMDMKTKFPNYLFKTQRHEVTFETEYQVAQQFALDTMAGKTEDVVIFPVGFLNSPYHAVQQGYFEDLEPYIENNPGFPMNDLFLPIWNAGLTDGKRYVMPLSFDYRPIITTAEALQRMGYSADHPFTLDEWTDWAVKTREEHGQPLLYSMLPDMLAPMHYSFILLSGCPNPCDLAARTADFDTLGFRQGLRFVEELYKNQGLLNLREGNSEKAFRQWGGGQWGINNWLEGILLPGVSENFRINNVDQQPLPIGYPHMGEGSGDIGFVHRVVAVNGFSKEKQAAADFCMAMMDTQVQTNILLDEEENNRSHLMSLPVNRQAIKNYADSTSFRPSKAFLDAYVTCLESIQRGMLYDQNLENIIGKEIEKYMDGNVTEDQLIQTLNQRVNLYLKE